MSAATPLRTILVDDEPLAIERIAALLQSDPEIQVIAQCSGGAEALAKITSESPDLVFLDVKMPEVDGLQVVQQLPPNERPVIVFVTAYSEFAVEAFELAAVDYLLKPFNSARFEAAVERAKAHIRDRQNSQAGESLNTLLQNLAGGQSDPVRLALRTPEKTLFLDLAEIDWIGSARNYVEVHVGPKEHLVRETLQTMEKRLPVSQFFRINRSTVINLRKVREILALGNGQHTVVLRNGTKLSPVREVEALQELLEAA